MEIIDVIKNHLDEARVINPMRMFNIINEQVNHKSDNIESDNGNVIQTSNIKFEHLFDKNKSLERLLEESKTKNLIVAFDFDNTLYKYKVDAPIFYSENVEDLYYKSILDLLLRCQNLNMTLILFTTENVNNKLKDKIKFCKQIGLNIEYVNKSPIMTKTKKPYYNILLDDRAGLEQSFTELTTVVEYLEQLGKTKEEKESINN